MPIFIDIEACGLGPGTWPIEIAWGDTATGEVTAYLIEPAETWDWAAWEMEAERVHGIAPDMLYVDGYPPEVVARQANLALAGAGGVLVGHRNDVAWADKLHEAAGVRRRYGIREAQGLWHRLEREAGLRLPAVRDQAWEPLLSEGWQPHRAAADVRHMMAVYHRLTEHRDAPEHDPD